MTHDQEQATRVILRELAEIRVMMERLSQAVPAARPQPDDVDFLYLALCEKAGIDALGEFDTGLPETPIPK